MIELKYAEARSYAAPETAARRLQHAIAKGWLVLHESGTFVTFTPEGADLFAA